MNKEIERIKYFIPKALKDVEITEADEKMFAEYSERGLHKDKIKLGFFKDGFSALREGKRWQGIHMQMWEDGVLEGVVPYFSLLGGENPKEIPPRYVVDFMKKEMFKGIDAELIENVYQEILNNNKSV